jgi:hypothetical protein
VVPTNTDVNVQVMLLSVDQHHLKPLFLYFTLFSVDPDFAAVDAFSIATTAE